MLLFDHIYVILKAVIKTYKFLVRRDGEKKNVVRERFQGTIFNRNYLQLVPFEQMNENDRSASWTLFLNSNLILGFFVSINQSCGMWVSLSIREGVILRVKKIENTLFFYATRKRASMLWWWVKTRKSDLWYKYKHNLWTNNSLHLWVALYKYISLL